MPARRHLPLLLCAAALGIAGSSLARAADAPPAAQVTIAPADGGPAQSIALAGLAGREDVHEARYVVRDAEGTSSELIVSAGFSLGLLLREAGVDLDAVTYVELPRADGTSVLVLREQIVGNGGDGPLPVVWVDAEGTHFLRPSAGADDVNADDVLMPADGAISVRLRTGAPFAVRIDVSARRARPHEPIRFGAVLVAGSRTPDMDFDWYFADGSQNGAGAHVTHRFRQAGAYLVQVNVTKSGRTLDAHDVQVVRVHARARQRAAAGGGGGGGGGAGDRGADSFGTTSPGGGTTSPGGGSTSPGGGSPPPSAAPSHRSHPPRGTAPPASIPAPRGRLVSGTLLASADTTPLPAGASGPAGHTRDATQRRPVHIPVGAWIAAVLAILLAAGWTLESRHIPPFWQP